MNKIIQKQYIPYYFIINLELVILGWIGGKLFETLNVILIANTLFWLWKYTAATQEMKHQMLIQNEFTQRPILNLYFRYEEESPGERSLIKKGRFALRNVSGVTAYNIIVENIIINDRTYKFFIDQQNSILEKDGDEKALRLLCETPKGIVTDNEVNFQKHFSPESLKPDDIENERKRFSTFLIKYTN